MEPRAHGRPGSATLRSLLRLTLAMGVSLGGCGGPDAVATPDADAVDGTPADAAIDAACTADAAAPCYAGPPNTRGVGRCQAGTRRCVDGRFGPCTGQVLPFVELCDNEDNDCDGEIDETLTQACYTGPRNTFNVGLCKAGKETCVKGVWVRRCVGEVRPAATEICDNEDNDCDGSVDEALFRGCKYTGPPKTENVGLCKAGRQPCAAGKWGVCVDEIQPKKETCDNKDNDCDGSIDDAVSRECPYSGPAKTKGVGPCKAGTQACAKGVWGKCSGEVVPKKETCDFKDEDCDGKADNGFKMTTYYRDADGDAYGDPKVTVVKCKAPPGYVGNNKDCYDKNRSARPGQTASFYVHRGDGKWDYNCDGREEALGPTASCPIVCLKAVSGYASATCGSRFYVNCSSTIPLLCVSKSTLAASGRPCR